MRSGKLLAVLTLAVILCCGILFAQTNLNEEQGLKPYDALHGGDLDSVSLTSGGLALHIPLASFPQRGNLDLSFMLRYSSKGWQVKATPSCFNPTCKPTYTYKWVPARGISGTQVVSSLDWWIQTVGTIDPSYYQTVSSPEGNAHQLGGNASSGSPVYPSHSLDATGLLMLDANTLVMPNGTRYSYVNGLGNNLFAGTQPSSVTDANGNQITITSSGWTDTLGRLVPGSSPGSTQVVQPGVPTADLSTCPSGTSSAFVWNIPGVAGVNNGVRTFKFCYSLVTLQTSFQQGTVTEYGPASASLLTAIVLPDLTIWTLSYDSYGDVTTLGFPTGGSISYTYATRPTPNCSLSMTQTSRWVTSRTVNANDGTGGHMWNYVYTIGTTTPGGTTTVTSPDGNDTVHTIVNPVQVAYCNLYDSQVQYYQGSASSGTLLKTVATQFSSAASPYDVNGGPVAINVVPTQVTATWPDGHTSKVVNTYDSGGTDLNGSSYIIGSLLEKDEYDFSNTLVRSTVNHFLWQDNATYKTNNLVNLPAWTTVYNGAPPQISGLPACNATGTPACVAQTSYAYDQGSLVPSGVGTPTHLAPPAGEPIRGNLTSASHWLDTAGSFISSTATYFDTGMKASSTPPANADGLNRTTTYSYAPGFLGAYLTQTNMPDTQMPDAGAPVVHHVISGNYDFNTGLLTSLTDENGQTFSYQYDNMLRLTQGNHPDGGITKNKYPDPNTIERQRLISGSTYDDFKVKFDGLGRAIQTQQLTPDCASYIKVDTTYDSAGRTGSVSNPYCLTSEATYGTTTTQYDALSRATKIIRQDGSTGTVQYNAPAADGAGSSVVCTTATDEAGKQLQSCTDGLGRMVKVLEPGDSYAGTAASGTMTINGTLQTNVTGGHAATAGTGSVTINPAGGSDRSTQVLTHAATSGSGTVTISGSEQSVPFNCTRSGCSTMWDTGSVTITVNGHADSASYGRYDTPTSIASNLVAAINGDSGAFVTATASGATVTLATKTAGASTNYALSATSATTDPADFGGPSFTASPSGATLTGGTDNVYTTYYDAGTVTITVNGHSNQVSFGQNDSATTIASNLASTINGDSSAFVNAAASGNTVNLTSRTLGSAANVSLGSSYTYDSGHFSTAYFTTTNSGSGLTGGTDAVGGTTVYDAGTVSVTIGSFNTSVAYGQNTNNTAAQVASAVASAISVSSSPVMATSSGSNVSVTYKSKSAAGNVAVTVSSSTSQGAYFTGPSFTSSGTILAGGTDPRPSSLSSPYVTTYQYNARGDMLCVHQKASDTSPDVACTGTTPPSVPGAWRQRFFTYDSFSRILTAMNPENNSTGSTVITYSYDADGNLTSKKEPAPNQSWGSSSLATINYTYDALNRLLDTTYSDGTTRSTGHRYDYSSFLGQTFANPIGREVAATTANNTIASFTSYDPMGRVASTVQCNPGVTGCKTFTAAYDKLGDMTSLAYPGNNFTVTYGYDSAARLTTATDSNGITYAQNPTFLANGAMKEFTTPNFNNNKYHVDYNNRLQPTEIWTGTAQGASALFDKQYQYNPPNASQMNNGNIYTVTNIVDSTRTQTFAYDSLNRLISAGDQAHWANTYTYDPWGNLTNKTPGAPAGEGLQKTADTSNHLSGLGYDAAGNEIADGSGNTFVYDAENRITTTAVVTYTYDADGRRIAKSSGTNYWYGPSGSALAETDSNGNWTYYVFFGGQRLARNVPQPSPSPADIKYYISDHLHSTAMFVDKAGTSAAVLDDNDFYPWGGVVPGVGKTTSNNALKFTGQYRDAESNLDYFGARYYANTNGRFMSPDWAAKPTTVPYATFGDPQSLNLYSYVRNSPIVRVDEDGHFDDPFNTFGGGGAFSNIQSRFDPILWDVEGEITTTTITNRYADGTVTTSTTTEVTYTATSWLGSFDGSGTGAQSGAPDHVTQRVLFTNLDPNTRVHDQNVTNDPAGIYFVGEVYEYQIVDKKGGSVSGVTTVSEDVSQQKREGDVNRVPSQGITTNKISPDGRFIDRNGLRSNVPLSNKRDLSVDNPHQTFSAVKNGKVYNLTTVVHQHLEKVGDTWNVYAKIVVP